MAYSISTGGGAGWGFSWTANESNYFSSGGGSMGGGSSPAAQTNFPTSQYGQTVPVIYGKARVPGAYVWAPELIVKISTSSGDNPFTFDGVSNSTTTVTVRLSARLRFGRPLTADSRWSLRRMWADGVLILDKSTGFKKSGLNYVAYDGHSSQGRDPTQVAEEGETNVSAHRSYLDVVIKNYDMPAGADQPPFFEAEWVQEATSGVDADNFTAFFADAIDTWAAVDFQAGEFYGISNTSPKLLRKFSIDGLREIYAVQLNGLGRTYSIIEEELRFIPSMDRILGVGLVSGISGGAFPLLIDASSGASVAEAVGSMGAAGQLLNTSASFLIGGTGLFIGTAFNSGMLSLYRFTSSTIERVFRSGASWDGRGDVECFAVGDITDTQAVVWAVAGTDLYKIIVAPFGILSATLHASDADDLVYCVVHDDDVIVWTDAGEAIRIDGVTGATVWTATVPYQISSAALRSLAPSDMQQLNGTLYYQETTFYNFTDLDTGTTTEVAKSSTTIFRYIYDGEADQIITTDNATVPKRTVFEAVGTGTQRDLEDFLIALMIAGGFDASEVDVEGVDDVIDGAVIDVTGGVRAIAGSVCEAYSIAMFERAGKIIFKRAATDGGFAVDATFASADYADQGGQAIRAKRLNPEERPAKYGINYRDQEQVYQVTTQWGEIPSIPFPVATTDIGVKADVPIISDADTIKTLATVKVNKLAVERHEIEGHLKPKHMDAEPESVAQTVFANRLVTMRLLETVLHPDFTQTFKATEFLSSTAVSISGASGRPIEPSPAANGNSRYYHLDIPLVADSHDLAGAGLVQYHVLASGGQTNWDGATLFRKDAAGTYQAAISQVTDGLVGVALSVLPDCDIPYTTEFTRSIDVAIISGDTDLLVSATYLEMMNGANFFAIGQPGRWEVCQVMTLSNNGDGTFNFLGLSRGRGSSEEYTGLHAMGDLVVWLSEDNVQRLDYTIASLDDAFDFKPVGFGGSISGTPAVNRTITGEAEKIPKPCHISITRVSTNLVIDWVRRSRLGSYWADDGDDTYETPLGESLEQYVIRIKSGPAGSILRTITVDDATTYNYSDANQTTDFGSTVDPGESLTIDIRQVSGTGVICPTREATITL